jgi:hypothetical protein
MSIGTRPTAAARLPNFLTGPGNPIPIGGPDRLATLIGTAETATSRAP